MTHGLNPSLLHCRQILYHLIKMISHQGSPDKTRLFRKKTLFFRMCSFWASQGAAVVENPLANAGGVRDASSISGSGRSPGGGNGTPLQYSCLKNSMSRRAWQTAVCGGLWVCKELDTTECAHARAHTHTRTRKFVLFCS